MAMVIIQGALGASAARAAELPPGGQSELRRGLATVGAGTSDQPALRQEALTRAPSSAYALGSALGAWKNASAALDFDLKNPSGDGDDSAAIGVDCFDEKAAFTHLDARVNDLGLTPAQVVDAAGLAGGDLLDSWKSRHANPPARCR
jgi:hypothetical protein